MFLKLNIILLVFALLYSGCKSDKQPEYVDEKPTVQQETPQNEVKKQDTTPVKRDSITKNEVGRDKFDELRDMNIYEGKNLEISGRVSTFRGKPQMILDKKSQIKIVN